MISKYFELFESNKKTYLSAAIDVLSNSENPLTVEEICFEINKQRDIFIPKSSFRSLLSTLISYSKGKEELSTTKQRNKRGILKNLN